MRSRNRAGGERKLAARVLLDTLRDIEAGVDRPKGLDALDFANSEWFDYWVYALDRNPADVRRLLGRVVARSEKINIPI